MLYFNKRVREDIIKTFNRLAYAGGFTQLAAAAALYYKEGIWISCCDWVYPVLQGNFLDRYGL